MSSHATPSHPLDQAIALCSPTTYRACAAISGLTAAQVLTVALNHPQRLGEPIAFTGNYAATLTHGPFKAEAEPVRTNRSTHLARGQWRSPSGG